MTKTSSPPKREMKILTWHFHATTAAASVDPSSEPRFRCRRGCVKPQRQTAQTRRLLSSIIMPWECSRALRFGRSAMPTTTQSTRFHPPIGSLVPLEGNVRLAFAALPKLLSNWMCWIGTRRGIYRREGFDWIAVQEVRLPRFRGIV